MVITFTSDYRLIVGGYGVSLHGWRTDDRVPALGVGTVRLSQKIGHASTLLRVAVAIRASGAKVPSIQLIRGSVGGEGPRN